MKKIIKFENLQKSLRYIQSQGSIVLVGGCFDILHKGHLTFLENAKKQGDTLLVLLESDRSIKRKKGNNRPVNTQKTRGTILASLAPVDFILLLPDLTTNEEYYKLTNTIKPDIIAVTKGDPLLKAKKDQAEMVGGKVIEVLNRIPHFSTTELMGKHNT